MKAEGSGCCPCWSARISCLDASNSCIFLDGEPENYTSLYLNLHLIAVVFLIDLCFFFFNVSLSPYLQLSNRSHMKVCQPTIYNKTSL